MFQKKLISVLMGSSLVLVGCGGGGSSSGTPNTGTSTTTVSAMGGTEYLVSAELFALDDDSVCVSDGEPLGTTDAQGQVTIESDLLANGYCAISSDGDITLLAPKLQYLEQSTQSYISPYTTYLQQAVMEGSEQLDDIATAKQALAEALSIIDSDLLISDYLTSLATASDAVTPQDLLAAFAQLWMLTADSEASFTPSATVNMAKVNIQRLNEAAQSVNSEESSELLQKIATFVYNHKADFASDDQVDTLKESVNDPLIFDELPQSLIADNQALKEQIWSAINEAVSNNADQSINIDLTDIQLTELDSQESDLLLTMSKQGADWPTDIVVDTTDAETGSYSNQTLTISELTFNQQGKFDFSLSTQKLINEQAYLSAPVKFTIELTEQHLENTAPQFVGMESELVSELISSFNNSFEFNDELNLPEYGLYIPADATLKPKDFSDSFNALFSDTGDASLALDISSDDPDYFFFDMGGSYLFTSGTIEIPSQGSTVYQYRLFATDSQGARSDQGFDFLVTVNSDKTASVTAINGSQDGGSGSDGDGDNTDTFIAVMLKPSHIEQITDTLLSKLGVEFEETTNVVAQQIFEVREYSCNELGECERGTTVIGEADVLEISLSQNSYIHLSDGEFVANDIPVVETESAVLSATLNGEQIKIYAVDSDYTLLENDLQSYSTELAFTISEGPNVDVNFN